MKIKKRLFLSMASAIQLLAVGGMVISCGQNVPSKKSSKQISDFSTESKITIASAIPKTWPQYKSILRIVQDWNENHQDVENFKPVVFLSKEETKSKSYADLNAKVNKLLKFNSNNAPEILISNFSQVYELAAMAKLLDLSTNNTLDPNAFDQQFIRGRKNLRSKNYTDGLWAVPFTVTTNSSLAFNKPVMKQIITLMQNHGMRIIGTHNPFLQSILNSKNDIDNYYQKQVDKNNEKYTSTFKRPSRIWKDNNPTDSSYLSDYTISDQTFKYYDSLFEFARKAKESLRLISPVYILGSYFARDFISILDAQNGVNNDNFPLFRKKTSGQGFEFPFLENKQEQEKIKKVFKIYHDMFKDKIVAKPEKFNIVGLRNGQYAFSTMPSVSARYSYRSRAFGSYTNNGFNFEDFAYLPQISKFSKTNTKSSYSLAETSLMAIKKNSELNKSTLAFIKFLYKGKMKEGQLVTKYLAETSGYVIPMKDDTTDQGIQNYNKIYNDFMSGKEKDDKNHSKTAIYRSIKNTFESISNGNFRNFDGDQYTAKLLQIFSQVLNKVILQPKEWDANKFIDALKEQSKFFDI